MQQIKRGRSLREPKPLPDRITQVMTDVPRREVEVGRIRVRFFVKRGVENSPTKPSPISVTGARPNPRCLDPLLDQGCQVYCGFDTDTTGQTMARAMIVRRKIPTNAAGPQTKRGIVEVLYAVLSLSVSCMLSAM